MVTENTATGGPFFVDLSCASLTTKPRKLPRGITSENRPPMSQL